MYGCTTVSIVEKEITYNHLLRYVPCHHQLSYFGYPEGIEEDGMAIFTINNFKKTQCQIVKEKEETQKICCRCKHPYIPNNDDESSSDKRCFYHWGKLIFTNRCVGNFTCCNGPPSSQGCIIAKSHVWSGLSSGLNGPFPGYVKAPSPHNLSSSRRIYGLDSEMVFTEAGLELCKVSLVDILGKVIYDQFVQPENPIVDFNTQFSGITASHYRNYRFKSLRQTQYELMAFIKADTILIGHGLENDLRALKLIHQLVVDTSLVFMQTSNFPNRPSLKDLAVRLLNANICENQRVKHGSIHGAVLTMRLMMKKLKLHHNLNFLP